METTDSRLFGIQFKADCIAGNSKNCKMKKIVLGLAQKQVGNQKVIVRQHCKIRAGRESSRLFQQSHKRKGKGRKPIAGMNFLPFVQSRESASQTAKVHRKLTTPAVTDHSYEQNQRFSLKIPSGIGA